MQGVLAGLSCKGAGLVYGDNLYMYGPAGGEPLTEEMPYVATTRKGKVRASVARSVEEAHARGRLNASIVRGSDFFGPRVVKSVFGEAFFRAARTGKKANLLGNPDLPHAYTFVRDMARLMVRVGEASAYGAV
jgi:nucleoside-diphosphate-sugar epimerase